MNSVNLIGRLTRDVESRQTKGDQTVANMRLAVPRRKRNGEQPEPVYIDVVAFGALGDLCAEYLAKGRQVAVSGRLEYSEWKAQDDTPRSKHEVIADTVDFLDRPQQDESQQD
jgi:single-strand DNA-binding protein